MVRKFCQQCFTSRGMCADFAIHDKGDGNPHVHILLTTRRVDENGFTTKERSWNDKSTLLEWRKLWADWCNHKLYAVSDERIDHRSYAAQGIDKIPQVHLGAAACAIEKKGYRTDKGSRNRKIMLSNLEMAIEAQKQEVEQVMQARKLLRKEYLETELGCASAEMHQLMADLHLLDQFAKELRKRNVPCHLSNKNSKTGTIFFPKADYNEAVEAWNIVEGRKNPTAAPSEQKQDNLMKRHRSR